MMKLDSRKTAWICGFLCLADAALGSAVAAVKYRGKHGQSFSPLNHFVSDLGDVGVSQAAPFFNACLVTAGLLLAIFMVGLGRQFHSKTGTVAAVLGVLSALSGSAVGLVPMNHLIPHVLVAFCFFYSAPPAIALFSTAIHFDRRRQLSKWLQIPGVLAVVSLGAFDAIPVITGVTHLQMLTFSGHRPHVLPAAMLEWWALFTAMAWIVLVSVDLAIHRRAGG